MGELGVWSGPARSLGDAAVAGKGGRGPRRCPRRSGRGRRVVPRRAGRTPRDDPFRLRHADQRRLGHGAPREAPASLRPRRGGEPRRRRHPPLVRPGPGPARARAARQRSEEHTSELQSRLHLVCRLLLEKKKKPRPTPLTRNIKQKYSLSIHHHTTNDELHLTTTSHSTLMRSIDATCVP